MNRSALSKANGQNGLHRENRFAAAMARRGVAIQRNRLSFRFRHCRYTPDFYDPTSGVYYEVIGSRQRFHQLVPRLDLMAACYPGVRLEVVHPSGEPYVVSGRGVHLQLLDTPLAQAVNAALLTHNIRLIDLAKTLGVSSSGLSQVIHGKRSRGPIQRRLQAWLGAQNGVLR